MKFISTHGKRVWTFQTICIFDGQSTNISIWSYSRQRWRRRPWRKIENCLICWSNSLDIVSWSVKQILYVYIWNVDQRRMWHVACRSPWLTLNISRVHDQFAFQVSLSLSLSLHSFVYRLVDSIRFNSIPICCLKSKNKNENKRNRINNKQWIVRMQQVVQSDTDLDFFLYTYCIERAISVWEMIWDRCLCDWSRSTQVFNICMYMYIVMISYISFLLARCVRVSFFLLLSFETHSCFIFFCSFIKGSTELRSTKGDHFQVPWRTTAIIVCVVRCLSSQLLRLTCIHACIPCMLPTGSFLIYFFIFCFFFLA